MVSDRMILFRFQTGSIKSCIHRRAHIGSPMGCFDSKLVRLKDELATARISLGIDSFDSKLVRLKGKTRTYIAVSKQRFDSKLVRLKGSTKTIHLFYRILTGRVKSFLMRLVFRVGLQSIGGCAK